MTNGVRPGLHVKQHTPRSSGYREKSCRGFEAGGSLAGHHRVDAVRAHLLEMAGRAELAIRCYASAAERTTNIPERNYLITRAADLREATARRPPTGQ